jgi:predicted nicotinamide N-methyase
MTIAGREFDLLLPADPDMFLEHLEERASQGEAMPDPYWARLWPCAIELAASILNAPWPHGEAALEIGCGVGLAGLAGLHRGLDVTFSDLEATAVALARENAQRNGYPDAQGIAFDWHEPPCRTYPTILASDVLYDIKLHDVLLSLLEAMLSTSGVCWIGDPGRVHAENFVQSARTRGFAVRLFDARGTELRKPHTGGFQRIVLSREDS